MPVESKESHVPAFSFHLKHVDGVHVMQRMMRRYHAILYYPNVCNGGVHERINKQQL